MPYEIRVTRTARKDIDALTTKERTKLLDILVNLIAEDPFAGKKLRGDMAGSYSVRLNLHDRVVYSVDKARKIAYVERTRSHYGD